MTAQPRQAGRIPVRRGIPAPPPRGTRPRNRRQLIIAAAADMFASDGYAQVSMADVAAAVAVQPSALYRHVRGKDDLLYQVIDSTLAAIQADVQGLTSARELAVTALDHRQAGVLWQRESRHLPPAARERLRARLASIAAQVAAFAARRRPDRHTAESDLLAWSCLEAATSISFQRITLPGPEYTDLLTGIIDRVLGADLHSHGAVAALPPPDTDLDRRDELLTAAARLFAERGYHSVGVDDVGTAVGIAGPSVYHHFTTKLDLIVAVMNRGADQLLDATAHTLAGARDDTEALDALLRAYTSFSLTHSHVMDVLIAEIPHLPEPHRTELRQIQRRYLGQWLHILTRLHPSPPPSHIRVQLQAALSVINDIARAPELFTQPPDAAAVTAIGHAILDP
ncbi:MAG TPA: TetR/AcrR family transcriptional regulator [Streptosporangiaceae bacterium]|nr:TetR/AcrR family transcriptional regulator [Streptosporangiaceae bacterium]